MSNTKKRSYSILERAALATAFGKSIQTINRWIKHNNPVLTSDTAKKALTDIQKVMA